MADEQRQGRREQVATERRRRGDSEMRAAARLPIPDEVAKRLKAQGLVPRWVNDQGNRIHQLTVLDDYDPVEGVEPVPVSTAADGTPIKAHLMAKPKEFIEEDRSKAEARRAEVEAGLLRGEVPATANTNQRPAEAGEVYVDRASHIGRGNQILE